MNQISIPWHLQGKSCNTQVRCLTREAIVSIYWLVKMLHVFNTKVPQKICKTSSKNIKFLRLLGRER
uniref:Uncharacterized protein n=1 Tax=Oryza brachyantha TaxID=4533 RepID=J3KU08_ORYBR